MHCPAIDESEGTHWDGWLQSNDLVEFLQTDDFAQIMDNPNPPLVLNVDDYAAHMNKF